MINKNVKKIIASFLVLGSLSGIIATSTTEAASRDYQKKDNQKIEYRIDQDNHKKVMNKSNSKVNLKDQKADMKKVREIIKNKNIHLSKNHWIYGKRVPERILVQYRQKQHNHDSSNNDLLLGLILGAVISEAANNN